MKCQRTLSINNDIGVWGNLVWGAPAIATVGSGAGSASGVTNTGDCDSSVGAHVGGPANTSVVGISGSMLVTSGSILNCSTYWLFSGTTGLGTNTGSITVNVNGFVVFYRNNEGTGSVGTGIFTIPIGVNIPVIVSLGCYSASGAGPAPAGDAKNSSVFVALDQA